MEEVFEEVRDGLVGDVTADHDVSVMKKSSSWRADTDWKEITGNDSCRNQTGNIVMLNHSNLGYLHNNSNNNNNNNNNNNIR